jgi:glycosyltransferase involved in cell wall biosynthesis
VKVLHIVNAITPDGAHGGAAQVALNQAKSLLQRGHEVTVVAGTLGYRDIPHSVQGVPVKLFPARFLVPRVWWPALYAKGLRRWVSHHLGSFDIAHIHMSRDLVSMPAALSIRRAHLPYVIEAHGMITPGSHPLAPVLDRVATKRLFRQAGRVFFLDDRDRLDLEGVAGRPVAFQQIWHPIPIPNLKKEIGVVDGLPEVLFLARLHTRKRPDVFALAAAELLRAGVAARFSVVGPPEGAEDRVDEVIEQLSAVTSPGWLRREPGLQPGAVQPRMAQAAIYVLPSVREPFGLTIVEALAVETPVVINEDCGLAPFVNKHRCGLVVGGSVHEYAAAIRTLLENPALALEMGKRGKAAVESEFAMDRMGRELENAYNAMMAKD